MSVIKAENLSKKFVIAHESKERYTAIRDVLARGAKKIFSFPKRWSGNSSKVSKEEFWALKDLNFEIKQGDRVGIIGRNGAGKSTLLKILSRITPPTEGKVTIKGRVASLLEVGTGFHPELTGRENIFLNGAVLGMSRAEIRKKFDEIVAFAEVEMFLDTPVKRFSSGMYVRLAFSVAAHLEPEILIVDEVLAVGDAQFQKKCLGKMEDVSKEGRTVLFVSHNMGVVKTLCDRAILLQKGKLIIDSSVEDVLIKYLVTSNDQNKKFIEILTSDNSVIKISSFYINNSIGGTLNLSKGQKILIEIIGVAYKPIVGALDLSLYNIYNERILFYSPGHLKNELVKLEGEFCFLNEIQIPTNLNGGSYGIHINFSQPNIETFFSTHDQIDINIDPTITITGRELNYENSAYILLP